MTESPGASSRIAAIILAAGSSRRMGTPKQLLRYQGRSLLRHVTEIVLSSSADEVFVVLGAEFEKMAEEVRTLPVQVIHNDSWPEGLSSSIKAGIARLPGDATAAIILLCDQHRISTDLLNRMIGESRISPSSIVACAYGGTLGVPALFPRSLFPDLSRLTGDRGAQELIRAQIARVRSVPFPDGTADIDTIEDTPGTVPVEAFLFDFGKVICGFDIRTFVDNISSVTEIPPPRWMDTLKKATDLVKRYETGLVTSDEFFHWFVREAGVRISQTEFRDVYCNIFTPIPSTFALIRKLKPRYRLGLLSNTSEWHFLYGIKPVEVFPLFDTVTLSYQVRAMKPAEAIYRDALAKLGVAPDRCIYIDDLQENVDAGRKLGLKTIHYTSHEELLASLQSFGVVT
jgi:molybdenum cofactor cytidylyltransferase